MSTADVEFLQFHKPAVPGGLYTITQTITPGVATSDPFSANQLNFFVGAERFALGPDVVFATYPPPQLVGTYDNVLPHIELTRSTLPWERNAGDSQTTWLALILIDAQELGEATTTSMTAAQYRDKVGLATEPGEGTASDPVSEQNPQVTVLSIGQALLKSILASSEVLQLLTHVRRAADREGTLRERPSLVCNRLPKPGSRSQMHLISLEGRLDTSGAFVFPQNPTDPVLVLSLFHWEFTCLGPDSPNDGTFAMLCGKLNTAQLCFNQPTSLPNDVARRFVELGSLPLPHALRGGGKTVSWYRGPFVPTKVAPDPTLPAVPPFLSSDVLLGYDATNRMLDTSLAAAWELGRLMVLADPTMAANLQRWKLFHRQQQSHAEDALMNDHLPFMDRSFGVEAGSTLSAALQGYFKGLSLLQGVPFAYLVPDESYLPNESIRFFQVDPRWCAALLDGAFSIGHVLPTTSGASVAGSKPYTMPESVMSGVLLRSDLVSGWPALQVDAYDATLTSLSVLRFEKLGGNVLLVLFDGVAQTVDVHLPAEHLHFGLEPATDGQYTKYKRDRTTGKVSTEAVPVPFSDAARRTLDVIAFRQSLAPGLASGALAAELIQGVPRSRFTIG